MTSLRDDIAATLQTMPAVADTRSRQYALEAGVRISAITGPRPYRVDSAELIGFIHNRITAAPPPPLQELADAIVDHFRLEEN